MMAETQSMALIIQASTAESSRPPQGLWLLPQNLLTSISLRSSFIISPPSLLPSVVATCDLALSRSGSTLPLHFLSLAL